MNRLIEFIKKIYLFVIFIILEVLAFNTYQDSSIYTRGELYNLSNKILVHIHKSVTKVKDYFELSYVNENLARQNAELSYRLSVMEDINLRMIRGEVMDTLTLKQEVLLDTMSFVSDSTIFVTDVNLKQDRYISARVVNNSVHKLRNYITLDRGKLDSVKVNSPVVSNGCIVGYIVSVSNNYSVVISMLNSDFRTNGMSTRDGALCSIFWDGKDVSEVQFSGISRYSDIYVGDTITTTGFSNFFTGGKLIGTIKDFEIKDQMYYRGNLKLFIPFDKLRFVDIIYPDNLDERIELEQNIVIQ